MIIRIVIPAQVIVVMKTPVDIGTTVDIDAAICMETSRVIVTAVGMVVTAAVKITIVGFQALAVVIVTGAVVETTVVILTTVAMVTHWSYQITGGIKTIAGVVMACHSDSSNERNSSSYNCNMNDSIMRSHNKQR